MKYILRIILTLVPLVLIVRSFFNTSSSVVFWTFPHIDEIWILLGAVATTMIAISIEVQDWSDNREAEKERSKTAQELRAREEKEEREQQENENRAKATAIAQLGELVGIVSDCLGSMAHQLWVLYPGTDFFDGNWFDTHYMYRTNLLYAWERYMKNVLASLPSHFDMEQRLSMTLNWWQSGLERTIEHINIDHPTIKPHRVAIREIQRELQSNFGIHNLKDPQRDDPKKLIETARESMQRIVDRLECIDMSVRREDGVKARAERTAEMRRQNPNTDLTSLIRLKPGDTWPPGSNFKVPHRPFL